MTLLLVLPVLIPLLTAVASLLAWRSRRVHRWMAMTGASALLVSAFALLKQVSERGIHALQIGDWPAPFGITLVADQFSAIMVAVTGFMGFCVTLYSLAEMDRPRESFGYYPLLMVLLMGVSGAFLTGDLFNLYVWFEVMLMASFVLLALGGEEAQLEGAIKYVTLNLISSALFLAAVGILYGIAGTLNMADLSVKLKEPAHRGLITTVAMLFFVAFGIKAAAFPLFFWLPASYHTPPVAVSAIFSALLTKVGVYSLIRTFTLLFVGEPGYTHAWILVVGGLTMVTGVLGAVAQLEFRRLLAFHIVSQIGYLLMGLGLLTAAALAGSVYFMMHVIFAKSALFLVSGVVYRLRGTYDLKKLGGLYGPHPWLAALFLIAALSLAGIPPSSGFFAKLALIRAGLVDGQYGIVVAALGVSLLTLFSMIKIWNEVFWKKAPETRSGGSPGDTRDRRVSPLSAASIVLVCAAIVAMGLAAEIFLSLAVEAGRQLMEPDAYVRAVLGEGR
ncbi:MAG TPA: Na+/H+ antiporter subunit D [candidate division Zixibacteria bacterium]|nr:Na+/H+ antiporter subunit D [candidate division Zixibacteria bacterium]